jgi:hypothetical protein
MAKPKPKKVIVLQERKLGREQAHGQVHEPASDNPLIEIDERLRGLDRLTIVTHEAIHVAMPTLSERGVIRVSKLVASVLWADNYRRVDQ